MTTKKILLFVSLLVVAGMLCFFFFLDRDKPEITWEESSALYYLDGTDKALLLTDVTAKDRQDGDLTKDVIVESVYADEGTGFATVTYAVSDSAGNVAKEDRIVNFLPRFEYAPDECVDLIFDSDFDTDVDDVGALAILHSYAKTGKANIIACVCSCNTGYACAAMDAVNTYFGRPDIPIGIAAECPDSGKSSWQQTLAETYENDMSADAEAPQAVPVYRQALSSAGDHSVVIIVTGMLNNLADLLDSVPDEISQLTGKELIFRKVKCIVVMGGVYPDGLEYNFSLSPKDAAKAAEECPVPIAYVGFELGNQVFTADEMTLQLLPEESPVASSYRLHASSLANTARPSWDMIAALYAIDGSYGLFDIIRGENQISPEDGSNSFVADEDGKDAYLVSTKTSGELARLLNDRLIAAHEDNPK